MAKIVIVATGGAGGDLPPLLGAVLALRERGHEVLAVADGSARTALGAAGVSTRVLPSEVDLGPFLIGAIRDAMAATGGDLAAAGPIVAERLSEWARMVAPPISAHLDDLGPDVVLTSLLGSRP